MSRERTTSRLIYRNSRAADEGSIIVHCHFWCATCARLVSMATMEQAASVTGQPVDFLLRKVERRELHSVRQQSGAVLICLNSLL